LGGDAGNGAAGGPNWVAFESAVWGLGRGMGLEEEEEVQVVGEVPVITFGGSGGNREEKKSSKVRK